jgi:hypothetical protein
MAFICSGMTAVAYFFAHAGRNLFPIILNGGELAALYAFVPPSCFCISRPLVVVHGVSMH